MKHFALAASLALGLLAPAVGSAAVTYDAFTSFNGTQGAGNFRYIEFTGPSITALMAPGGATCQFATQCLKETVDEGGIFKASALTPASIIPDPGVVLTLPKDQLIADIGGLGVGIIFFAPTAGTYTFHGSFTALTEVNDAVNLLRITAVALPALLASDITAVNFTYTETRALAAGQFYGFRINPGSVLGDDYTGFNFSATIGGAPEPATWAMLVMGFGGLGAALRRRRAFAAA